MQLSQTLTGVSHPRTGTARLFVEQEEQTPSPQSLQ